MTNFNTAGNQTPKYVIRGASGNLADVNSSGHILVAGNGSGVSTAPIGHAKIMIVGPSGFVADVDSQGTLGTA